MKLAIIGGSGLGNFPGLERPQNHRVMTAWGEPSDAVTSGLLNGVEILFLPRHGATHRLPPHRINCRANISALADLGAQAIIGTAAVGGIEAEATTGMIVIAHQLIDYTYGRDHTYFDGAQSAPQHTDFTEPYAPGLREELISAAASAHIAVLDSGIYGATQGPRLETAAEIDRLAHDGCTIVGMTGIPEAALARECGIDYANLSLVVNRAAGRAHGPIMMDDIERELARGMEKIRTIIAAVTATMATGESR